MQRRRSRPPLVAAVLIAVGVLTVPPAHAAEVAMTLSSRAGVQAGGAGLVVQVSMTCTAGLNVDVSTAVTQRQADGSLVRGGGYRSVRCIGATQDVRLPLHSNDPSTGAPGGRPFTARAAFVSVTSSYCDPVTCYTSRVPGTVAVADVVMDAPRFSRSALALTLPATGVLEADGAGAVVRVPYRCTAGVGGHFEARLLQRTPTGSVIGSVDSLGLTCTGADRTGVLAFHAPDGAWRAGSAFFVVGGSACGPTACFTPAAHRVLALR